MKGSLEWQTDNHICESIWNSGIANNGSKKEANGESNAAQLQRPNILVAEEEFSCHPCRDCSLGGWGGGLMAFLS